MEVFDTYKNYRQYKPEYQDWKASQDLIEAKRLEYLKQNPDKVNQEDIERGKVLLQALDVMDEYSQSNAEDMEVATEAAQGMVMGLSMFGGALLGMSTLLIPAVRKNVENLVKKSKANEFLVAQVPNLIGAVVGIFASIPFISWAAKVQVGASRKGRFEAMRKDLQNPNNFAILTEEQKQQAAQEAEKMPTTKEMEKIIKKKKGQDINLLDSFKNLRKISKEDKIYKEQRKAFEKTLDEHTKNFDKPLSAKDIEIAKKDQQLLSQLVQKVDIASQDYAENVEMATNLLSMAGLGVGAFSAWAATKISKLLKLNPMSKAGFATTIGLPVIMGIAPTVIISTMAAKVQKLASRVGRFKVKQELSQKNENFVYVDDKEVEKQVKNVDVPANKKPNIFKFFIQAYKDTKAYEKYMKENGIKDKKMLKAVEDLKLSEQQIKDAKSLQQNTFKTFNKVDDKSQYYAESVEAVGEMAKQPLSLIGTFAGLGLTALFGKKDIKSLFKMNVSTGETCIAMGKLIFKYLAGISLGVLPTVALEVYTTKEQKKASRIADMLALKDLNDYKHYVDYGNLSPDKPQEVKEIAATPQKSSGLPGDLVKKYSN